MDLSEYERERLENIKRNQQVLRSLNIPKLTPIEENGGKSSVRTKSVLPSGPRKKLSEEPTRRSSRLLEKLTGVKDDLGSVVLPVLKKKELRLPRPLVTSRVSFAPQLGATEDFLAITKQDYYPTDVKKYSDADNVHRMGSKYRMRHEQCIIKLFRSRIYSMAVHPGSGHILAVAGSKEGELGFWDATEVIASPDFQVREEWQPRCFLFSPHSSSISNLKFDPFDCSRLFTTSYDGSCLKMDLGQGTFEPWYQASPKSGAVTTGFDLTMDGRSALHSNTDGVLHLTDLRTHQTNLQLQLHQSKIGGLSLSPVNQNALVTCSNDRTICLWDLRKLVSSEPLSSLPYKNAVTAVSYHPFLRDTFASTCYDDHVRIHNTTRGGQEVLGIPHNNQTGRWVTLFKAVWDPKSTSLDRSLLMIGNMEGKGVDLYDGTGLTVARATSSWLTAQPAVNVAHPGMDVIVSGNASGKIVIWST